MNREQRRKSNPNENKRHVFTLHSSALTTTRLMQFMGCDKRSLVFDKDGLICGRGGGGS